MEILIKASQFILSLSILIIIHEIGHFTFAKIFKCRVEKFYLFFDAGFSIFKKKIGETEYGIGWLPLGGYVKISGMIDESMDKEQLKAEPKDWEFRSKPAWQRLLIMVGGVFNNIVLAFILYTAIMLTWGTTYLPNSSAIYGMATTEVAEEIGFQNGDKVISIDNNPIDDFNSIVTTIIFDEAKTVQVDRAGKNIEITIDTEKLKKIIGSKTRIIDARYPLEMVINNVSKESPAEKANLKSGDKIVSINGSTFKYMDEYMKIKETLTPLQTIEVIALRDGKESSYTMTLNDMGLMGIEFMPVSMSDVFEIKRREYTVAEAIPAGIDKGVDQIENYFAQLKLMFNPELKMYKSIGGFISVGKIFPSVWDWQRFWELTAFLSIMLGVLNILPIPALDGGHVMFLMYEIITGRTANEKFMEYAQIAGMILLLGLLLFANGNDIIKQFM